MMNRTLFIDPGRCIGCQACVAACRECDSHRGKSMISLDYIEQGATVASMPTVCMHCEDPVAPCAEVCPTDAILVTADGVVQEAAKERCIGCANCVHACPFGVPEARYGGDAPVQVQHVLRPVLGRVGADVRRGLPHRPIFYGSIDELLTARPGAAATDLVVFGEQEVRTGVAVVVPAEFDARRDPGGRAEMARSATDADARRRLRADPRGRARHASRLPADPRHDLGRPRARRGRGRGRHLPPPDRDRPAP